MASILNLLLLSSATLYVLFVGSIRITTTFASTGSACFCYYCALYISCWLTAIASLKKVKECMSRLVSTCIGANDVDNCGRNEIDMAVKWTMLVVV